MHNLMKPLISDVSIILDFILPFKTLCTYILLNFMLSILFISLNYFLDPAGFDIQRILTNLEPVLYDSMEYEHKAKIAGGRSQIIILIANSATLSEADVNFSEEHMRKINEESPGNYIYILKSIPFSFVLKYNYFKHFFRFAIFGFIS